MNKVQYEQENNIRYMKMEFCNITEEAEYEIKMLMNNKISIFLPITIKTINNRTIYFYNVTSKQQFCKLYEFNKLQMKDIELILNSLEAMAQIVNNYMLNLDSVMVTPEMLFLDLTNKKLMFTYVPICNEMDFESNLSQSFDNYIKELFDFIIEHFDHEYDKKSVVKIYQIYQKIIQHEYDMIKISDLLYEQEDVSIQCNETSADDENDEIIIKEIPQEIIEDEVECKNKSLVNIISMIKGIGVVLFVLNVVKILAPEIIPLPYGGIVPMVVCVCLAVLLVVLSKIPDYTFIKMNKRSVKQPFTISSNTTCNRIDNSTDNNIIDNTACSMKNDFKENDLTNNLVDCSVNEDSQSMEHTMLLSDYFKESNKSKNIKMTYCGEDNLEDIVIDKLPCIIGSMSEHCNYVINSKIVSHIHMCILKIEDIYYIEDMNSTNGTYVNGERLIANKRKEIKKDDLVLIATLPYKVEMIS